MSTGPEHYREAERLVERAAAAEGMAQEYGLIGRAQVHAKLAEVAAVVEASPNQESDGVHYSSPWWKAIS